MITPMEAQFGGIVDRAKRKAQEAMTEGRRTETKRPESKPTATSNAPSTARGSAQRRSSGQGASDTSAKEAVWPGLVLDEALVKTQQAEARKYCEEKATRGTPRIDCECVMGRFPEWRLLDLSTQIRSTKARLDSYCAKDPGAPECAAEQQLLDWLLSKEGQNPRTPYPYATRPPTPRQLDQAAENLFNRLILAQGGQCVNPVPLAEQHEKSCLESPSPRPPGTSTAAYCGCVKQEMIRLFQERKVALTSNNELKITGEAQAKCREESR